MKPMQSWKRRWEITQRVNTNHDSVAPETSSKFALKCLQCTKTFPNEAALNIHVKVQHDSEGEVYEETLQELEVDSAKKGLDGMLNLPCSTERDALAATETVSVHLPELGGNNFHDSTKGASGKCHGKKNQHHFQKCPICKASFSSENDLSNHMRMAHQEILAYQCGLCSTKLITLEGLKSHFFVLHGKQYKTKEELLTKENVRITCMAKDSTPKPNAHTRQELSSNSQRQWLSLSKCTHGRRKKLDHKQIHIGIKLFQCQWPGCQRKFGFKEGRLTHYKKHSEGRISTLNVSEQLDESNQGATCDDIRQQNDTPIDLDFEKEPANTPEADVEDIQQQQQDVEIVNLEAESVPESIARSPSDASTNCQELEIQNCPICQVPFTTAEELCAHMSHTHQNLLAYKCALCSCKVKTLENFRSHMYFVHGKLLHTNQELMSGDHMSLSYMDNTSREDEEIVEVDRKNHSPSSRNMKASGLTDVMSTNSIPERSDSSGEKIYTCNFQGCKKVFTKTRFLILHAITHSRDKTFSCMLPDCGLKFVRKKDLESHQKTHAKGSQYHCAICKKSFLGFGFLTRHMEIKHNYKFGSPAATENCNTSDAGVGQEVQGNLQNIGVHAVDEVKQTETEVELQNSLANSVKTVAESKAHNSSGLLLTNPTLNYLLENDVAVISTRKEIRERLFTGMHNKNTGNSSNQCEGFIHDDVDLEPKTQENTLVPMGVSSVPIEDSYCETASTTINRPEAINHNVHGSNNEVLDQEQAPPHFSHNFLSTKTVLSIPSTSPSSTPLALAFKNPNQNESNIAQKPENLFKCSFEGCEKQYKSIARLREHNWVHAGVLNYQCLWPGCQRKFAHNRDMYRHYRRHTGGKAYNCGISPTGLSKTCDTRSASDEDRDGTRFPGNDSASAILMNDSQTNVDLLSVEASRIDLVPIADKASALSDLSESITGEQSFQQSSSGQLDFEECGSLPEGRTYGNPAG